MKGKEIKPKTVHAAAGSTSLSMPRVPRLLQKRSSGPAHRSPHAPASPALEAEHPPRSLWREGLCSQSRGREEPGKPYSCEPTTKPLGPRPVDEEVPAILARYAAPSRSMWLAMFEK